MKTSMAFDGAAEYNKDVSAKLLCTDLLVLVKNTWCYQGFPSPPPDTTRLLFYWSVHRL